VDITLRQVGSVFCISFVRPLNLEGDESIQFRDRVKNLIADGRSRLVVDLENVKFIDSFGLGALVSALRVVRGEGGDLKLAKVPPSVESVLRLTRLSTVFDCHASMDAAVRSFQAAG
jgi:anti-sigma B factor antagonist